MKYNSHEKLKASGTGVVTIMTKGRNTTYEECKCQHNNARNLRNGNA